MPISPWRGLRLGLNLLIKNSKIRLQKVKVHRKNETLYRLLDEIWDTFHNKSLTSKSVVDFTTKVLASSENFRSTQFFPVNFTRRLIFSEQKINKNIKKKKLVKYKRTLKSKRLLYYKKYINTNKTKKYNFFFNSKKILKTIMEYNIDMLVYFILNKVKFFNNIKKNFDIILNLLRSKILYIYYKKYNIKTKRFSFLKK